MCQKTIPKVSMYYVLFDILDNMAHCLSNGCLMLLLLFTETKATK